MTAPRIEPEYRGPERREREPWRFKREVSWGDVGLAFSVIVAALLWGRSIETRLISLETTQAMQARVDARQDDTMREAVTRIEAGMRTQSERVSNELRDVRQYIIARPTGAK